MKKGIKKLTVIGLSSIMLASTILPALAEDNYSYDSYDYDSYEDIDYSYDEPSAYQQPQVIQEQPQQQPYQQPQTQQYTQTYTRPSAPPQNYGQVPVQNNYSLPPLQGRVVTVPPGTMIPGATATRTLSSQNLRTGDTISVALNTPFYYAGAMVLPAGTNIMGTVVTAQSAGRAGRNGQLMIVFNQAVTPQGQRIGLTGKLATEDGSGVLKGGTAMDRAKEVAKDTAIGAGSGALFGLIGSAISGGNKGKGAAIGTAIGGGLGAAKTVIDKGKDVVIEAGERLNIILDSELRTGGEQMSPPVSVPAPSSYNQNYNYSY